MVFSSALFLFIFLPLTLTAYFLARGVGFRNTVLLAASLLFYAWGEGFYLLILLASIGANYGFGRWIASRENGARRRALTVALVTNLLLLASYKYSNFIVDNLNACLGLLNLPAIVLEPVHLPLGISFFTFQAISYIVDVYRRDAQAQDSVSRVALYIALFPQLVAGPIVRYTSVEAALNDRRVSMEDVAQGGRRFVIGLAKKVLIANVLGETADKIFALPGSEVNPTIAWLGILCYSLQIYFDFSGYSDMAIGLGRMLGFRFGENFRAPYLARSVRDFWRRWHISLSTWFRDYVYIPLGGNRRGEFVTWRNLLIVFFLTGLWHGASWNFIVWGLFHGLFLSLERTSFGKILERTHAIVQHLYLLLIVGCGWVLFRADTLNDAAIYLLNAVGLGVTTAGVSVDRFMSDKLLLVLIIALLLCTPINRYWSDWLNRDRPTASGAVIDSKVGLLRIANDWIADLLLIGLLLLSMAAIAAGTYNPFIYFRF